MADDFPILIGDRARLYSRRRHALRCPANFHSVRPLCRVPEVADVYASGVLGVVFAVGIFLVESTGCSLVPKITVTS